MRAALNHGALSLNERSLHSVSLRRILLAAVLSVSLPIAPAIALMPTGAAAARSAAQVQDRLQAESDVGGVGIRLLDVPVATQDDPRVQRYIVDNLPPGTTIERRVQVVNETSTSQSVSVYAGSAQIVSGTFVGDDGAGQNALTGWTSVSEPNVVVEAGGTADVVVTVAVPADAPEGEVYGAIWAEVRAPDQEGATVRTASRVGVRMYVSVGPGNGAAADFSIGDVQAGRTKAGLPQVTALVTNTGGRAVDVTGSLALTEGPSALSAGPFLTDKPLTLAPGERGEVVVAMGNDLPDGPWHAVLTLSSGLVVHETTGEITFPKAGEAVTVATESGTVWPLLIGAAVLAAILALGAVIGISRTRARRRNPRESSHQPEP